MVCGNEGFDSLPTRNDGQPSDYSLAQCMKLSILHVILVVSVAGIVGILGVFLKNSDFVKVTNPEASEKAEIRSREDIKKQQELLVQETYLMEQRAKLVEERERALKTYTDQLGVVETQLEEVRAQKTSFQ